MRLYILTLFIALPAATYASVLPRQPSSDTLVGNCIGPGELCGGRGILCCGNMACTRRDSEKVRFKAHCSDLR